MSFDSLAFLIFLPLVTALHWLLPHRFRWVLLLAASLVFYASWNVPLTLLLVGVTAVTYAAARLLERLKGRAARRGVLLLALAACVGLLLYFKYFNLLGESLTGLLSLFGAKARWEPLDILLPVGVSFYTFQAMSCVLDVWRGKALPCRHFGYYALYISFFPQLVAGPIERAEDLLPQLRAERRFRPGDLKAGGALLLAGYFRKLVIADFCGQFVNAVYALERPDGFAVLGATVLFAFQIYCDFSGYSEIAKGAAKLLGIDLMDNFDRPYLAPSLRQFWRRWHISLSRWFTDYVYVPLGGSRRGFGRRLLATLAVFALSGLWHGADATFLVWGLYHGGLLCVELALRRVSEKAPASASGGGPAAAPATRRAATLRAACAAVRTFLLVSLGWIFFRAESLAQAGTFLGCLFSPWDLSAGAAQLGIGWIDLLWLCFGLAQLPLLYRLRKAETAGPRDTVYVLLLLCIAFAWLYALDRDIQNAFIYFQF